MKQTQLIWLLVPVLNTLQQVFLKQSAETVSGVSYHWLDHLLMSPWFMAAIAAEIACFGIWMTVLSEVDLSAAFPLSAVSYVLIMAIAWIAYGEPVLWTQIVGSVLILAGAWLVTGSAQGDSTRQFGELSKN
ncbi:EamA family transporter [Agrobacterium larrymoorei]|uniref:EamA family transporter n=1 Tax=Agrobacterium larrymoorei TaxID=160699 RepID=A0AAF0HBN3_9HYPH|nr:EamA family transporter [Agrobacterium larrymoorei]WHA44134.1 EamA family transporter [Agrobacterium larrymoorei]